jgi:hypothetical protein
MNNAATTDFDLCLVLWALSTLLWESNRKFLSFPIFIVGLVHFIVGLGKFTGNA